MTSLKQIEANRLNAEKSTGPVTLEGKQQSRCNAVRHGLTAETVIAGVEDKEDYQAFEAAVIADYDAESAVERELVLRLASILWRLRRATSIETSLFEAATHYDRDDALSPVASVDIRGLRQAKGADGFNTKTNVGDRFLRLIGLPSLPLDRLSRYEGLLWRQAHQISITLEFLRLRARPPRRFMSQFRFATSGSQR